MSASRRPLADERGFTLIEVMVTVSLGMVVLLAILGASEMFARSATVADKTTSAQEAARVTVRSMVHVMRQARSVTGQTTPIAGSPTRSDLVVAAYVPTTTGDEAAGWVHFCATADPHPSLVMGIRVGDPYAAPGACSAADTTNGWQHAAVLNGTLQDSARLFDYTTSACTGAACPAPNAADISAVGIRLAVGTSPEAAATFNSVVRDAVSFRNRSST